ncbi:MAG: hypothetical protein Aureis2KO_21980 [Aureisphaera sp.]
MNFFRWTLCFVCVGVLFVSCKSDSKKEGDQIEANVPAKEEVVAVKQDLNDKNLLVKTMSTPEAKVFTSALVTTGLTDLLNADGPYTIFAPSSEAFDGVNKTKLNFYLNPENKEAFTQLVRNHIVGVDMSSADLLQAVRKNKNYELETLGGAVLKVSVKDGNLFLTDAQGNEASLGKTDILASNGKLHIIGNVLSVNAK